MRLVLDTNTVLALWVFSDPALRPLRTLCEQGKAVMLADDATLLELERVLGYPEFGLAPEQARDILAAYRLRVEMVRIRPSDPIRLPVCRDKDDQKFLELARDGRGDFLLSRDKAVLKLARRRMLCGQFAILSPEKFAANLLTPN